MHDGLTWGMDGLGVFNSFIGCSDVKMYSLSFGVDIDNVICKTDQTIRFLIKKRYGIDVKQEDVTQFDYCKCKNIPLTEEQGCVILDEFHNSACRHVKPMDGAKEALLMLRRNSHYIYLITSRDEVAKRYTEEWLKENNIRYDELIFSTDKHNLGNLFDYLVEDSSARAKKMAHSGDRVFLIDYPWNRRLRRHPNILRVKGWDEIVSLLRYFLHLRHFYHTNGAADIKAMQSV